MRPASRRSVRPVLVLAALVLTACTASRSPSAPAPLVSGTEAGEVVLAADAWRPAPCGACAAAGIAVELRKSRRSDGSEGTHVVARVRNLNARAVVFAVDFIESGYGDTDGTRRHEPHRLHLAPAGTAESERLIVLRLRSIGGVVLSEVEELAAGS